MQDAACDHLADRCKTYSRAECDDTFQSLFCKSDLSATGCANAFKDASCGGTPAACQGIADTAPAIKLCNQFISDYCDVVATCGKISKVDCLQQSSSAIPCGNAVGIAPRYEACQGALSKTSCNAQGAVELPESCKEVVKLKSITEPPPGLEWQSLASAVPEGLLAR